MPRLLSSRSPIRNQNCAARVISDDGVEQKLPVRFTPLHENTICNGHGRLVAQPEVGSMLVTAMLKAEGWQIIHRNPHLQQPVK